jgi:hypothetical protein
VLLSATLWTFSKQRNKTESLTFGVEIIQFHV